MRTLLSVLGIVDVVLFSLWYFKIGRGNNSDAAALSVFVLYLGGLATLIVNVIAIVAFAIGRHFAR